MKNFRSPILFLVVAGFIAALFSDASAVVHRRDKSDTDYLRLGAKPAFASVGRVEIDYGGGFVAIGTATLFGPDRLVSAAHVFDQDALFGAQGVRVNFGNGRIQNIDFQSSGVVNINPGYNSTTLQNDVSVVFLAQKFNLTPGKFYAGKRLALETPITFVGYGNTGTGLTGSRQYSALKRGGQNALGRYARNGTNFEVDFDSPTNPKLNSLGRSQPLVLEGLLGPGDSGGSSWVRAGKKWQLIGINSYGIDWFPGGRGNTREDDYGDRSGFVYLPSFTKWLGSLSKPRSALPSNASALSFVAVPEPSTLALTALGAVTIFRCLRRFRS